MRITNLILLLLISLISCTRSNQNFEMISGIYFESADSLNTDPNFFDKDNKIYTYNKKFVYDYFVLVGVDTFKIAYDPTTDPIRLSFYDNDWILVPHKSIDTLLVKQLEMTIISPEIHSGNEGQTKVKMQFGMDSDFNDYKSFTGLVENEKNVWLHPNRTGFFRILEYNPFPFIQSPLEIGNSWKWELAIGSHYADERWMEIIPVFNECNYKIIGEETIETHFGKLKCWVVHGMCLNEAGKTGLTSYFNEKYGFVKYEYRNIDGSRVFIDLIDIGTS